MVKAQESKEEEEKTEVVNQPTAVEKEEKGDEKVQDEKTRGREKSGKGSKKSKSARKCTTAVEAIAGAENLSSLSEALKAADLLDVVNGEKDSLTIFAPTDEAFEAALAALGLSFEELAEDKVLLGEVLSLHVVPESLSSKKLRKGGTYLNLLGDESCKLKAQAGGEGVEIVTGESVATVVEADIESCSAVIHIIDSVLLSCNELDEDAESEAAAAPVPAPAEDEEDEQESTEEAEDDGDEEPVDTEGEAQLEEQITPDVAETEDAQEKDIASQTSEIPEEKATDVINEEKTEGCQTAIEVLEGLEEAKVLVAAVKAAGLEDVVESSKTLFAPTDEAFDYMWKHLELPKDTLFDDTEILTEILSYHVLPKAFNVTELNLAKTSPTILKTASCGEPADLQFFPYAFKFFKIMGEGAAGKLSSKFDIPTCSGFVHTLDEVLLPCKVFEGEPNDGYTISRKYGKISYG